VVVFHNQEGAGEGGSQIFHLLPDGNISWLHEADLLQLMLLGPGLQGLGIAVGFHVGDWVAPLLQFLGKVAHGRPDQHQFLLVVVAGAGPGVGFDENDRNSVWG
jgi:hypothetical protein